MRRPEHLESERQIDDYLLAGARRKPSVSRSTHFDCPACSADGRAGRFLSRPSGWPGRLPRRPSGRRKTLASGSVSLRAPGFAVLLAAAVFLVL